MKRISVMLSIGAGLLTSVLTTGCEHTDKYPSFDPPPGSPTSYSRSTAMYGRPVTYGHDDPFAQSNGPPGSQKPFAGKTEDSKGSRR